MTNLNQKGDTLIEVTFAGLILAAVLATSYYLGNKLFQLARLAKERSQVTELMQRQAEYIHSIRDGSADWDAFRSQFKTGGVDLGCVIATGGTWPPSTFTNANYCKVNMGGGAPITIGRLTSNQFTLGVTVKDTVVGGVTQKKMEFHLHGEWMSGGSSTPYTADMDFFLVDNKADL